MALPGLVPVGVGSGPGIAGGGAVAPDPRGGVAFEPCCVGCTGFIADPVGGSEFGNGFGISIGIVPEPMPEPMLVPMLEPEPVPAGVSVDGT